MKKKTNVEFEQLKKDLKQLKVENETLKVGVAKIFDEHIQEVASFKKYIVQLEAQNNQLVRAKNNYQVTIRILSKLLTDVGIEPTINPQPIFGMASNGESKSGYTDVRALLLQGAEKQQAPQVTR